MMRFSMKDAFTDDLSLVEFQMSLGQAKTGSRGPVSVLNTCMHAFIRLSI